MDSFKTRSDIFLTLLPLQIESSSPPLLMDYPYGVYFNQWNEVEIIGRTYETQLVKEPESQSIPPLAFALGPMNQHIWILLPWRHQAGATYKGLVITQPPNISANIQVTPVSNLALPQQMPDETGVSYPHTILPHVQICECIKYHCCYGVVKPSCFGVVTWQLEQIIH